MRQKTTFFNYFFQQILVALFKDFSHKIVDISLFLDSSAETGLGKTPLFTASFLGFFEQKELNCKYSASIFRINSLNLVYVR